MNDWALQYLAAVHARLGEMEKAIELLRGVVREGRIQPSWKAFLRLAFAPPPKSEAFEELVREYEAEARRLRELY